jgi:hypothetical protein
MNGRVMHGLRLSALVALSVVVLPDCGSDPTGPDNGVTDSGTAHDAAAEDVATTDAGPVDASSTPDAIAPDVSTLDTGTLDTGNPPDAGTPDTSTPDASTPDTGTPDAGTTDANTPDVGTPDTGTPDTGTPDTSTPDTGTPDAGTPDAGLNPAPPTVPVKLIFIHHSTGENWLSDTSGQLGLALRDNNYFVSDTNYGWGPSSIGDSTDIGHWYTWFRGPNAATYMAALYAEYGQHSSYARLATDPGGANQIVIFKSAFPNSALQGSVGDAVPAIASNLLRDTDSSSQYHTVANAKGIYIDILEYFRAHQEKLFVVVTASPLQDATWSSNARAFNQWLVDDWLAGYPYANVFVFDLFNVLTTNGGNANTNDLGSAAGNHHRFRAGMIEHKDRKSVV